MNQPYQPSFRVGFVILALALAGASCEPASLSPHLSRVVEAGYRIFVYAASIVLEAAPFVFAGALAATLLARFAQGSSTVAATIAAFAPGCDCSMNGFASALRRCPAPLAGAVLTWGAVCNPIALAATASVLGHHLLSARIAGGLVAAGLVALSWSCVDEPAARTDERVCCSIGGDLNRHLETALRLLLCAALPASVALVAIPSFVHAHASPVSAALAGALLSPCSSADPIIAKILATSPAAQAALIVAGQCLDIRQLSLLRRHFGMRRALLAGMAGIAACATAALAA